MTGPLNGVRILALSQFGAGPYGMMQLADLGAEIVKIEHPGSGGDVGRYVPPHAENGDSLYYQSLNRNTRSLALDLRHPEGMRIFRELVRSADAVFSNLRGDQPERLGLTYEHLKEFNPKIVCCSLTGFGMTGPRRADPGYDYLIQAYAGFMSLTGEPDGPPARAGISVVDFSGGLAAALGLVVGVLSARQTGVGADVDVGLLDTAVSMLNYLAIWTMNRDFRPERLPDSSHPTLYPSQLFRTADSYLVIMCAKEKFWRALAEEMGSPEWAEDARFRTFADRFAHREELIPLLKERFATRTTAWWLERLRGKVPVAPVNSVEEALADEHVRERGMVIEVDHPAFGEMRQTASAISYNGSRGEHRAAPPFGADTETILGGELGIPTDALHRLHQIGVIRLPDMP